MPIDPLAGSEPGHAPYRLLSDPHASYRQGHMLSASVTHGPVFGTQVGSTQGSYAQIFGYHAGQSEGSFPDSSTAWDSISDSHDRNMQVSSSMHDSQFAMKSRRERRDRNKLSPYPSGSDLSAFKSFTTPASRVAATPNDDASPTLPTGLPVAPNRVVEETKAEFAIKILTVGPAMADESQKQELCNNAFFWVKARIKGHCNVCSLFFMTMISNQVSKDSQSDLSKSDKRSVSTLLCCEPYP